METSDSVLSILDKKAKYFKMAGQHVRAFVCGSKSNDGTMFPRGCAYAKVGSHVYIFGGEIYGRQQAGIFDFDTATLKTRKLDVMLPRVLYGASAASTGSHVYIFGGASKSSYLSTILDFDSMTATITTLKMVLPTSCGYTAAEAIGTHVFIFGGWNGSAYYSDIIDFDTVVGTVTKLGAVLPPGLVCNSTVVGAEVYVLVSGTGIVCFDSFAKTVEVLPLDAKRERKEEMASWGVRSYD